MKHYATAIIYRITSYAAMLVLLFLAISDNGRPVNAQTVQSDRKEIEIIEFEQLLKTNKLRFNMTFHVGDKFLIHASLGEMLVVESGIYLRLRNSNQAPYVSSICEVGWSDSNTISLLKKMDLGDSLIIEADLKSTQDDRGRFSSCRLMQ